MDSVAMLVGLHAVGLRPDLITFADTGGELPETYAYLPILQGWLASVGFPEVTVVRYQGKHGRYNTLEGNCLANKTLPSLAFGRKGCSLKFKTAPQNAYRRRWPPAIAAWKAKRKVVVAIGYDAGPKDSRRSDVKEDTRYTYRYFLREWGLAREACEALIAAAGLPVPIKSACFFCPSRKPPEVAYMVVHHPALCDRVIGMERGAAPNLTAIEGLWRNGTKGTRGGEAKPGRMGDFIAAERLKRGRV